MSELKLSNNNLGDIIQFLKNGDIVCLHENGYGVYYFSKERIEQINNEQIIYIDVTKKPSLMDEDEWPWYIENEGFVEYKSTHLLPNDKNKIHKLKI
jgi:hypothetical protein